MKNRKCYLFTILPHYYNPPEFGGAVRVYHIIKELLKNDIKPIILEISEHKRSEKINNEVILYINYNQFKNPIHIIPISILLLKLLYKYKIRSVLIEYTTFRTAFLIPIIRFFKPNTIIIVDAHNVEYIAKKNKWPIIFLVLTFLFEFLAVKLSHILFCVSKIDKEIFFRIYGRKKRLYLSPNGVDIENFLKTDSRRKKGNTPKAVFHGLYIYKPNKEAFDFIIKYLAPKLPNVRFILFGKDTEKLLLKNRNIPENVEILGTLPKEKVPKVIKSCDIAVVPIFWGSGTNLKVIEYMAAGLTIVATRKAVRGLDLKPNKDFYLAETVEEFIDKIKFAIDNPINPKRLVEKAKKYDWEITLKNLIYTIKKLICNNQSKNLNR